MEPNQTFTVLFNFVFFIILFFIFYVQLRNIQKNQKESMLGMRKIIEEIRDAKR